MPESDPSTQLTDHLANLHPKMRVVVEKLINNAQDQETTSVAPSIEKSPVPLPFGRGVISPVSLARHGIGQKPHSNNAIMLHKKRNPIE